MSSYHQCFPQGETLLVAVGGTACDGTACGGMACDGTACDGTACDGTACDSGRRFASIISTSAFNACYDIIKITQLCLQ